MVGRQVGRTGDGGDCKTLEPALSTGLGHLICLEVTRSRAVSGGEIRVFFHHESGPRKRLEIRGGVQTDGLTLERF